MEFSREYFLQMALIQARKAWGSTFPNPMVGAVLVRNGEVIAQGYHHRDGLDHAEIDCLKKVDFNAEGCDMYVTLEPCSTKGRTGACTEAIKKSGVKRVVIGALDPNPAHRGRALEVFKEANIVCEYGVLEDECRELNFVFNKNITSSEALLAIKYAISSDGKIAKESGKPTQITTSVSRDDVMRWRKFFPAIGVGFGTLVADNPSLTSRLGEDVCCPERLIFDASLRLVNVDISRFNIFADSFRDKTRVVCDSSASRHDEEILKAKGVRVMRVSSKKNTREFWTELKRLLYKERLCALYVEGGAGVFSSICSTQSADYVFEYKSPKVFNSGLEAFDKKYFSINPVEKLNFVGDEFTRGYPKWTQT